MKYIEDRPLRVAGEIYLLHLWRLLRWVSELRLVPTAREFARNPLRRPMLYGPAALLTRPGKILLFAALMLMLLSFRRAESFMMPTAALLTGLLVWSALVGWWYRPKLQIQRHGRSWAIANQPYKARINVKNGSGRPLYNFVIREMAVRGCRLPPEWRRQHVGALAGYGQLEQLVEITPRQRGALQLDGVVVDAYYPYFLTRNSQKTRIEQPLDVLPEPLKVDLPSIRLLSDQAAESVKFGTDRGHKERALDYVYSRGFQSGDPPSRLDRRASARRGEPMSKVYHGALKLKPQGLLLLCDLSLADFPAWKPRPDDHVAIDQRLALAVEVERRGRGEGLQLGGCWWNGQWQESADTDAFYHQVATAAAVHQRQLPTQLVQTDWIHLLITGRWDQPLDDWVQKQRAQGVMLLVLLIPESADCRGQLPESAGFTELHP